MIFPRTPAPLPTFEVAESVRRAVHQFSDAIVCVVGVGTLNDIVKFVSGELGREYMLVCTAASGDGFASYGASIEKDGFKVTRPCPAPAGIVADVQVLAGAPQRLSATGFGDLIEKISAGLDWVLADELGIEPIDATVWDLVQGSVRDVLVGPEGVRDNTPEALERLARASILSGLGMQIHRSSRPAAGSGHLFSSVWEMESHGQDGAPPVSHGFKVGVGTVAACALWEWFLGCDPEEIDPQQAVAQAMTDEEFERHVRHLVGPLLSDEAVARSTTKRVEGAALARRIARVQGQWESLTTRARPILVPPGEVARRLDVAGAPSRPDQIGVGWDRFREAHLKARVIRDRYTIFDVLSDLGVLDSAIEDIFSSRGYWGRVREKAGT
jgi:glycerol-1-phosphate dehydrogenase [NAD(P)+]